MIKKVTLEELAAGCNVSKATASYVLNNRKSPLGLSPKTISKVLEAAQNLNYRPDLVARALSAQKKDYLTLLVCSPWIYSQFSDFMVQVSHAIDDFSAKYKVKADYMLYRYNALCKILKSSKAAKYDAVIILGTGMQDNDFLCQNHDNFPNVILLNRALKNFYGVNSNDMESCTLFAERIAAKNHYQKLFLMTPHAAGNQEKIRLKGFEQGLQKYNGSVVVFPAEGTDGPTEFGSYLEAAKGMKSCFFFGQFTHAASFLHYVSQKKPSIPDDIGVVGFDRHTLLEKFISPELSTIDPRIAEMTHQALLLSLKMKYKEDLSNIVIPASIIEGGSVKI